VLLAGKVAIVTGGGQGVGRGIALALAREGAVVAVVGRTLEKCERTVAEIAALGGTGLALACDVGKREQVEEVVAEVIAKLGGVTLLVNNAHSSRPQTPIEAITDKDRAIALKGMFGALYFTQACLPHLPENEGRIVNLGSVSGTRGDAGFGAYAMAKEAIRGLSRVAARECGPRGITVNTVCPLSDSPGMEWMKTVDPAFVPAMAASTALGRIGSSERDVGRTVAFLCSEAGGYITGQTINVDGGTWIVP
jgi:NAD(P)-dependent dehydrogenase (short-subunit alcohol dehydrogenase family)